MLTKLDKGFVVGEYTSALIKTYSSAGASLQELAKSQGVSTSELCSPSVNPSADDYFSLIKNAQRILQDEYFGLHLGQNMDLDSFSVLGEALMQAQTIGDALWLVLDLEGFVQNLGFSQVVREQGCVRLIWKCHYQMHPMAGVLVESILAGIIEFAQQLAGRSLPILETTFIHAKPKSFKSGASIEYGRVYGSRCVFSHGMNSILVADDVLAWPNQLLGFSGKSVAQADHSLSTQVAAFLQNRLGLGSPKLQDVAEHFQLTLRTFQRRLVKEGVTYNQIVTKTRLTLAEDYLSYSNLSALEISQVLGFKEQSSFNHFFSEHHAMSPMQFRKRRTS